jgi:hypothetical protein
MNYYTLSSINFKLKLCLILLTNIKKMLFSVEDCYYSRRKMQSK